MWTGSYNRAERQHHFYSPFTFPESSLDPLAGDRYPHTVLDVVLALNLP